MRTYYLHNQVCVTIIQRILSSNNYKLLSRYVTRQRFLRISRRSVYIKNINFSHSILANLNNANKTACNEKTKLIFKKKQDLLGTNFCGGRNSSRKWSKSSFFIKLISWNWIQYIFISRGAVFSYALRNIWIGIQITF